MLLTIRTTHQPASDLGFLLGWGRRNREAASSWRGLARTPSVARCHRLALSRASARLVRDAIARLTTEEPEEEAAAAPKDEQEASIERTISLNERRLDAVFEALKATGAARVLDPGCGEGKLLCRLLADQQFTEIVGMDVSGRALDLAESRLKLDRLSPKQRARAPRETAGTGAVS